jgi:hypothetical protein
MIRFFSLLSFILLCASSLSAQTILTQNGKAQMPIVVSRTADAHTREQAATLAQYLEKISGAKFEVKEGEAGAGLALGNVAEFPAFKDQFQYTSETREDYLLRSHAGGVHLIAVGKLGVRHAVWDFLYRLGYRAFFPGANWEIIPRQPNLSISVDAKEHPDFLFRRIWPGSGSWPGNVDRWNRWDEINRMEGGVVVNTNHAWNLIAETYKEEFDRHPEYFALVDGKRQADAAHKKFCISNPGLRDLVGRYALDFFEKNPTAETVSIDPSDFGGWCQCEPCKAIGTPSDRQVVLANQTVKTVRAKHPGKYVAFYAYYDHSPPPSIKLEPGIIVSVTTAYIRGGLSFEGQVKGWRAQGAEIGTRDYMSVNIWDFDLPNEGKAAQLNGVPVSLKEYHDLGTRFYIAESSDSWGPHGLGYYFASRILWDSDEADRVDELFTDFLDKAFPGAQQPMREFYQLLTGIEYTNGLSFNRDYIGRLYRQLDIAWKATSDAEVRARLTDLTGYVHHLENYLVYRQATDTDARQKAYEILMRHVYRIRASHMVHGSYFYRKNFHQDLIKLPAGVSRDAAADKDPWKNVAEFTQQSAARMISAGLAANAVQDSPWKVALAPPLSQTAPAAPLRLRGKQTLLLHALKDGEIRVEPKMVDTTGQFFLTDTYSVTEIDGKLVQKGILQNAKPVTIAARAGQSFLFHVFSGVNDFTVENAAVAYRADIYRPQLPPGYESLFFFRRSGSFYVPIAEGAKQWSLQLVTQAPGETAQVTVTDPQGVQQAQFATTKESVERVELKGTPGFWKVDFGEAPSGALYKVFLSLNGDVVPWVSVDPRYPLIITK